MRKSVVFLLLALAAWFPLRADGQSDLTHADVPIDSLAQAFSDAHGLPSLVVGISVRGVRVVTGRGEVRGTAPNDATLYEIGSVSKVLTALALADGVVRGEVGLDTPVADLLPGWTVGAHADGPIRLAHLATHTSGLPRLALNAFFGADGRDPYAAYGPDRLRTFLANVAPMTPPGETYLYSNAGAGLLGFAMAQRADTSYAALVAQRVLTPLGMTDTVVDVAAADTARFAPAFGADGVPVRHWTFQDPTAGAGAWRSTASDLLTLAEAAIDPSATPLGDALALSLEPRAAASGGQIGLGWHLNEIAGQPTAWHNGQVGGAASIVAALPEIGVAVVVLTNASVSVDALGVDLLMRLIAAQSRAE